MPHPTLTQANPADTAIAILTTKDPIDYDTPAGERANLFFFTTGSPNNRQTHLKILAELSRLCLHTDFLRRAKDSGSNKELIDAVKECLIKSHGLS